MSRLFKEFAVTITVAILISGVVSITLTPMLCSRFLRGGHASHGWFYRVTERFFQGLLHFYDITLQWVLGKRPLIMVMSFAVLIATGWMFVKIPKGFIPDQDTDQLLAITEASQGVSFKQMVKYQEEIAEIFRNNENIEALVSSVGGPAASSMGGQNLGQLVIHLKPRKDRKLGVADVIAQLRPQLAVVPGMKVYIQNPPTIRLGGQVTKSIYQISMQSTDEKRLYEVSEQVRVKVEQLEGVEDVTSDLAIATPSSE